MYRIAKRFKSLAEGELPLDDISEWKVNENDPVDHFLYQSENSFGRKDIIKMKGLKRKPFRSIQSVFYTSTSLLCNGGVSTITSSLCRKSRHDVTMTLSLRYCKAESYPP